MKRLLYLLLVTCAAALAVSAMIVCTASEEQALPPFMRVSRYACLAPDHGEKAPLAADEARKTPLPIAEQAPLAQRLALFSPPLRISYVRAYYMAFHYSDEAG